jgi:hypothetical protein
MFEQRSEKRRWPRSQRFTLSEKGLHAESEYRAGIVASRESDGRESFDRARAAWAASFSVDPDDGMFLGEVRSIPLQAGELIKAVESAGKTVQDTYSALARLVDAGLIAALTRS